MSERTQMTAKECGGVRERRESGGGGPRVSHWGGQKTRNVCESRWGKKLATFWKA